MCQYLLTTYFSCFRHGSSKVVEIETTTPPLTVPTVTLNDDPSIPEYGAKQYSATSTDNTATPQPSHSVNSNQNEMKSQSFSNQILQDMSNQTVNKITLDTYQDEHGEPCSAV